MIGTHIGKSTRTGTGQLSIFVFGACTGTGGAIGVPFVSNIDSDTIVAANGDELHGSSVASGCFVSDTVVSGVSGTWTVDGGTGRFEGATGGGSNSAVALGDALSTSWTGTLTY